MNLGRRLTVANYRGAPVPRRLGFLLAGAGALSVFVVASFEDVGPQGWLSACALLLVLGVGVLDDLAGEGPRGLRNHLRALRSGRVTTGLLKAIVIAACSAAVVVVGPSRPVPETVAAILLISGASNLANSLDLRPGRTLKVFWPLLLLGSYATPVADQPALPGVALAALPALVLDLAERDMLGDGGSNLVGFAAGTALAMSLPGLGLWTGALVVVGLNVLAEVTSLSRLIDASAPLRAIDGLGRRRTD